MTARIVLAKNAEAVSALAAGLARAMRTAGGPGGPGGAEGGGGGDGLGPDGSGRGGGGVIFLSGGLGAGKTHWTRALLRALGETAPAPSPTFPLAQTYRPPFGPVVHHLDFYRLSPGEWRAAGLDEFLDDASALRIVEWPERAAGLPPPDLAVRFEFAGDDGRKISLLPESETGAKWLRALP